MRKLWILGLKNGCPLATVRTAVMNQDVDIGARPQKLNRLVKPPDSANGSATF
jgi:hypothetical protein